MKNDGPQDTQSLILDAASELFIEKGYEATSLQDIISATNFSKGAIYHYFASKEAIFEAVCERLSRENLQLMVDVRDDKSLTGAEKMQRMCSESLESKRVSLICCLLPSLFDDPMFLEAHVKHIFNVGAPDFVKPILEEGMRDGSIKVSDPAEMAELILVVSNLWLSPFLRSEKNKNMAKRCMIYNEFFSGLGFDLIDKKTIDNLSKAYDND